MPHTGMEPIVYNVPSVGRRNQLLGQAGREGQSSGFWPHSTELKLSHRSATHPISLWPMDHSCCVLSLLLHCNVLLTLAILFRHSLLHKQNSSNGNVAPQYHDTVRLKYHLVQFNNLLSNFLKDQTQMLLQVGFIALNPSLLCAKKMTFLLRRFPVRLNIQSQFRSFAEPIRYRTTTPIQCVQISETIVFMQ